MGILFSDQDGSSIVGSVGTFGVTGAVGYYGYKELQRRRNAYASEKILAPSVENAGKKYVTNSNALSGLFDKRKTISVTATELLDPNGIIKKTIMNKDTNFLEGIAGLVNDHGKKGTHINIDVIGGKVVDINTTLGGRRVSLGGYVNKAGVMNMPGGRNLYAPKFFGTAQVQEIMGGKNAFSMLDQAMNFNMARINVLKKIYGNVSSYEQASIDAGTAMQSMAAHLHEGMSARSQSRKTWSNVIMPILFDNKNKFVTEKAHNKTVVAYVNQLADNYLKYDSISAAKAGFKINPFALLKDEVMGIGGIINPRAHIIGSSYEEQAKILGPNFWDTKAGGNPLRQTQNRTVRFAKPNANIAGTNLQKIQGLYADDKFIGYFNKLMGTGAFGDVTTTLGKDGFLMSETMAAQDLIEDASKNIQLSFKGKGVALTHEANLMIADAMLQSSGGKYMSVKGKRKTARKLALMMSEAGNEGIRDQVYKDFAARVSKPGGMTLKGIQMSGLTRKKGKIALTYNPMSKGEINSNTIIKRITATEDGIRIHGESIFKFAESNKFWGSFGKLEGAGIVNTKMSAAATIYGMNNNINEQQMFKILTGPQNNRQYREIMKIHNSFDKDLELLITGAPPHRKNEPLARMNKPINDSIFGGANLYESYISADTTQANHGIGIGQVSINNIQKRRLMSAGFIDAAKELNIGSEANTAFIKNVTQQILPVIANNISGPSYGFKLENLVDEDINIFFGGDVDAARKRATDMANQGLANKLLNKSVAKDTVFYIDLGSGQSNNYRNIPLALFDSKYTGATNQYDLEGSIDILGEYNAANKDFIQNLRAGKHEAILANKALRANLAVGLIEQAAFKIDHLHPNSSSRVYVGPQGFDIQMLESLDKKHGGKVQSMLAERYGVSIEELKTKSFTGYNSAVIDEKLAYTDMYKTELASYKESTGISNLSSEQLSEFNNQTRQKLIKKGLFEAGGRAPYYGAESFTVSKVLDMEDMADQLNKIAGVNKYDRTWIAGMNDKMAANQITEFLGLLDQDKDPWSAITISREEARLATSRQWKDYKSPLLEFFSESNKGGLKGGDVFKNMTKGLAPNQIANVSQQGISEFYNVTMPYSRSINPYVGDVFQDSEHFKASTKSAIMEHYVSTLPERAIGSKSPIAQDQLEEIYNIFDVKKNNIEEARDLFKKHLTMKNLEGHDIMAEMSDMEIENYLKGGRKYYAENPILVDLMTKKATTRDSAATLHNFLGNLPKDYNIMEPGAEQLLRNRASTGAMREIAISSGDSLMNITKKIKDNKGLLIAGSALLAGAFLLQSPDNNIKNQEAREESRIKNKRTYENGINPPTGIVSKAVGGARYALTGELGPGMSAGDVQGAVGGGGSQYVINQSNSINSRYLAELQDDNKQNNWNYGG